MISDWNIKISDVAIVFATVLGPILAVQIQKFLERRRAAEERRLVIFRTLMATRASSLSPEHVAALNAIPIEFYGDKPEFAEIRGIWKQYIEHLYKKAVNPEVWGEKRQDLFNDLLFAIAKSLNYSFDKAALSREIYSPIAHAEIEREQEVIRKGIVKILSGEAALPLDIISLPVSEEEAQEQQELRKRLIAVLAGASALRVREDEPAGVE